jgi:hypothetical protein
VVVGGDEERGGGMGAKAVDRQQAGAREGTRGTMSSSRRSIWSSKNCARRPSSRSATRVA